MIFPEQNIGLNHIYNEKDFTETYFHGDYMRKLAFLLKDSDNKWKLLSQIDNIQNTEYSDFNKYKKDLNSFEKDLSAHISINQNPFLL